MKILAIETSCDETAAAVIEDGVIVLSNAIATSTLMHKKYGGIVPEIAAREQLSCVLPVIQEALAPFTNNQRFSRETIQQHIDAIAVTIGPGLIGSLLVGVETAKTIAFVTEKPIIPVNHVLAHMYANFIDSSQLSAQSYEPTNESLLKAESRKQIGFPAISLVVSGGHTELFLMDSEKKLTWLGGTLDDAAGEAFDKTARLLGFGNSGGPAIQGAASKFTLGGAQRPISLPRPLLRDSSLNFSFSGLKTAIVRIVDTLQTNKQFNDETIHQLAFEVQEAITEVLVYKTMNACKTYDARSVLISGGVAANTRLRQKLHEAVKRDGIAMFSPPIDLCTDNAVYIASYAYFRGTPCDWHTINASPDLSVEIT